MPGKSPTTELQGKLLERVHGSMEMSVLNSKIETLRTSGVPCQNIDDLPLSPQQKACVLEWLQAQLKDLAVSVTGQEPPLAIAVLPRETNLLALKTFEEEIIENALRTLTKISA